MSRRQQDHAALPRPAGREGTPPTTGPDQAAAALISDLRERDAELRPSPPGTPHPDPVLAARGWQTCEHGHGVYVRSEPQRETDREAG
jgi:hypothetical protein